MPACALCSRRPSLGLHRLLVEKQGRKHDVRIYACGECLWLVKRAGSNGQQFWGTGWRWCLPG